MMEAMTQQIDLKNLDKSTWKTFRFDEIAKKVSETVNPTTTDLTIYVGLEHIDANSIHLKRRGAPADVSGGKLKCYPGDVIFGKRRAYQRKAAIVDFEGICSAHAFVLRANPEVIDPKLFPFFLHSDLFMHRMIDISVGGLSPTINWGQLKEQEFLLPPKDQQAQLAELLWAMDDVIEKFETCLLRTKILTKSFLSALPLIDTKKLIDSGFEVIDGDRGKNYPNSFEFFNERRGYCLFLNAGNVTKVGFNFSDNQFISKEKDDVLRKGKLLRGDIILTTRGTVGNFAFYDGSVPYDNVRLNSGMVILRNKMQIVDSELFYRLCKNGYLRNEIDKKAYGSAQPQLSVKIISSLKVPLLSSESQSKILKELTFLEKIHSDTADQIESSKSFQKSLINQVF